MEERFFKYILRIFSAIYNPKVFIFLIFFYYVITIVEALSHSDVWRLLNMITFVLGMLTIICHREAYLYRAVNCFCNPFAESEKRTRSSTNNKYTINKVSKGIPSPWSNDLDISCRNSVNNLGLSIPPCRTPNSLFNISLMHESHFTRHSALENILFITFKKLPSIPLLSNL